MARTHAPSPLRPIALAMTGARRLEDRPAAAERRKPSATDHLLHAVWPRSGTARAAVSTQRGAPPPVLLFHGWRRSHKVLGSHADDASAPNDVLAKGNNHAAADRFWKH